MKKTALVVCVILMMAERSKGRLDEDISTEIRDKLEEIPLEQRRDIIHHVPTGVGTGSLSDRICAYCRQHNMQACIDKFCNDTSIRRLSVERHEPNLLTDEVRDIEK